MSQQKTKIKISKIHSPEARALIALDIIRNIQKQTARGLDKNGDPFPMVPQKKRSGKYSKTYVNSREFAAARKSKNLLNLNLTGELMQEITLLKSNKGELVIGYEKGNKEINGKAEGNIKGTYGNEGRSKRYPRDFLGIDKSKLRIIENKYDKRKQDLDTVIAIRAKSGVGAGIIRNTVLKAIKRRMDKLEKEDE